MLMHQILAFWGRVALHLLIIAILVAWLYYV